MQHVIIITGQISFEGQNNGLPPEIHAYLILNGADSTAINSLIEEQCGVFVRSQAMFVQRNQGKVIDLHQTPADRMLVPMRWIVSITAEARPLTGELSEADEEGFQRLENGSTPLIQ
jgi:hypothetical protein